MRVALVALLLAGCTSYGSLTGGTCVADSDCYGNVCLTRWEGGYCSEECWSHADCAPADTCVLFSDEETPHCYRACWYDEHCAGGTACYWYPFALDGLCLP